MTVNALPTVDAGTYAALCEDDSAITLTGTPTDANGVWTGTGVTDNGDGTASFDPSGLTGAIVVTYSYTDGNGCSASDTASIDVNDVPSISISSSPTCSVDLLTYSLEVTVSEGTVTSTEGTVTNTAGNVWSITDVTSGNNIVVTVTGVNGCDTSLNVTAPDCNCPVVDAPVDPVNQSYCSGDTIPTLSVSVNAGETVDWYDMPSGGTLLLSGSTSFTPITPGTYYAEARVIVSGCTSATRTAVTLTEFALPTVDAGTYADQCENGTAITLTGTPTDANGTWSGTGVTDNGDGTASFDPSGLTGAIVVTYTYTDGNSCTASDTASITVNATVTPSFSFTTTYCEDATADALPTTSDNGITGTWVASSIDTSITGDTDYVFTPDDASQCGEAVTVTVTVNATVTPSFSFTTTYCEDATADALPTTSDNGITGTWVASSIDTSITGDTDYVFTPDDASQCGEAVTVTVTVNATVTPSFSFTTTYCEDAT